MARDSADETIEIEIEIYTDGACKGNPGPGGWACILRHLPTGKETELSGAEPDTTNNRMELQAVIEGLRALKRSCRGELFTDSEYVRQGLESWMVTGAEPASANSMRSSPWR